MKQYLIKSTVQAGTNNFWISENLIPDKLVNAESIKEAYEVWFAHAEENSYSIISKTARKRLEPVYVDGKSGPIQVGFIVKAFTEIETKNGYKRRPIHIWTNILEVTNPF